MNGYDATLSTENGAWGRYPEADGNASYPIAYDYYEFTYTNEEYKKAAQGGYPLGDLNWWPEKKTAWEADENKEDYDEIIAAVLDDSFEFVDWADEGTAINENAIANKNGLCVYPNPVGDVLYIKGAENQVKTIYSLTGQMLLQTTKSQIDVAELQAGLYFIKVGDSTSKIQVK